jgi:hypothetical protein
MIIDYDYKFIIYYYLFNYILCYIMQYINIKNIYIYYTMFLKECTIIFQIFRSKVSTEVHDYCLIYTEYRLI